MYRLMSGAAAVLMLSVFGIVACANGAPTGRGARVSRYNAAIHVQGFYRVPRFHGWHGFYHQYPYTLFGYPNYNWSYYPLYQDYPECDFVWAKPTVKDKSVQRGIWNLLLAAPALRLRDGLSQATGP
jgi:hypothetical protein